MKRTIYMKMFVAVAVLVFAFNSAAQNSDKTWSFLGRIGYVIGGTTPMPLPEEIRSIDKFSPKFGMTVGVDATRRLDNRWGVTAGVYFFTEGMHTEAGVKNYHMGIIQGDDYLEGNFTGKDVTDNSMMGLTIPVMGSFSISARVDINLGPYVSYLYDREFKGEVYDGYLREGNPTGQKVIIDSGNPATYDFSDSMRQWLWGMCLGFDWKVVRHCTVFASLDWGLNDVFRSDFKTVEFALYPVYATFGVAYRY